MKDKWMFCKSKVCFFCKRNLESECDEEVVTGCPFCNRSFVE